MKRLAALAASLLLMIPWPAQALTAGEALDRMNSDQRSSYIQGAVDMISYEFSKRGEKDKSGCVIDWYYRTEGKGPREVVNVFFNHKDLPAVGILRTLVDRHCK